VFQGVVTHDLVKKMQYLDMCFSEVLRLNAPAGRSVFVSVCTSENATVFAISFTACCTCN